ncbi:MAG: CapA family protein [Clostridiales bacterium]|nr:CapA family protein [Clostridiales bacterium]
MSRRKSTINRKLNMILLFMTALLVVLVIIIYIDNRSSSDNKNDGKSSGLTGSLNDEGSPIPTPTVPALPTDEPKKPDTAEAGTEEADTADNEPGGESAQNEDEPSFNKPIILAFAGDVNLDEDSRPVARYDRENKGILGCISEDLVYEMNSADIFMLNNEFAFSTRGTEIVEKSYTFRAHPKRVDILKEMGTDIVSLANNHALDFGVEALLDTFTTLEEAGIDYVGAGINMDRAKAPVYYTIGDTTIAFVAASRVIYAMDWYATDTRPGMIGTYDPALFITSIKEARENSDFVVAYVHWGVERVHEPVEYQKELARKYIDAGADAIIGCHPHVMQGIEFYNGKVIAYSLGNYWFNSSKRESGLLKLYLNPDGSTDVQLLPVMNENTYTYQITDEDARRAYFEFMESISFDVTFDEEGYVSPR